MRVDTVIENGRLWTQDARRPWTDRLAVLNGRIVAVGDDVADLDAVRRVDLGGSFAVPGLNDAHYHLSHVGRVSRMRQIDAAHSPDLAAVYDTVRRAAAEAAPGAWIVCTGYDQNAIGGTHPTAAGLDAAAPGHPVWLEHCSGHMGVASSRVFDMLGHRDGLGLPEMPGGRIERDAGGRVTGLLQETAQEYVARAFGVASLDDHAANIAAGARIASRSGLTSVTEPGVGGDHMMGVGPADLAGYQIARDRGELVVRATVMPYVENLGLLGIDQHGDEMFGFAAGLRTSFGDEWLRLGATKIISDGSLIGRSAHMRCCYEGEPDNFGYLTIAAGHLEQTIAAAHRAGWQVAVHAIGDAAIDTVLDIIERTQERWPRSDPRHRIEHLGVADEVQIARVARLGVVPVPQGRFISTFGDGMLAALGAERSGRCYPMASLLDAGIVLPGSTDAPVADGSPMRSIHDMVNRLTASGRPFAPDEAVTIEQALRAYTVGSAYASHRENDLGVLAPGYLADVTVLSEDLLQVDPSAIGEVPVEATIVGGDVVHG